MRKIIFLGIVLVPLVSYILVLGYWRPVICCKRLAARSLLVMDGAVVAALEDQP